jgi:hypothetical protein
MATPAGTPELRLGAIVLPVAIPLLYLAVSDVIHSNQAFYRRKSRTFASVDGWIDRQEGQDLQICGRKQDERSLLGLLDVRRALLRIITCSG